MLCVICATCFSVLLFRVIFPGYIYLLFLIAKKYLWPCDQWKDLDSRWYWYVASGHVEHVSVREWILFYGSGRRLDRAISLKSTEMLIRSCISSVPFGPKLYWCISSMEIVMSHWLYIFKSNQWLIWNVCHMIHICPCCSLFLFASALLKYIYGITLYCIYYWTH